MLSQQLKGDHTMSETQTEVVSNEVVTTTSKVPMYIYIMYLVGLFVPLVSLIGLIMAYVNKEGNEGVANSHYRFQIRTFWMSVLFFFISFITMFILIGYVLIIVALVWFVVRCVKGLKAFNKNEEVTNVTRWGF